MPSRDSRLRLLLSLAPFAAALAAPRSARADAVDDIARAEMERRHIPGLSLAVLRDGKVVKTAAYGFANLEHEVPAVPRTVFQIQSITKTFTSAAILLLRDEGKLALEDPISKHLEGCPDSWKEITLRHLLSHTSGIKDFINEATASLRLDVSEEEVLRATAPRPLNFSPGAQYAYSNTNYHLLAMVIRKLTGKFYGDFLHERIFEPLEMADTRVVSLSALIPRRAAGYHWRDGAQVNGDFIAESILSYGGGGIVSTAPDMAKWAAAISDGRLLKGDTLSQAWTPAKLASGADSSYGLGWGVGSVEGHRVLDHSGGHVTGFTSQLMIFPEDRLAVVVLTNSTSSNPGRIARRIAGVYVSALAPRTERAIEDKNPEVTALLRECLSQASEWKFDPAKFTPELWKALNDQRVVIQLLARSQGALQSLELLARSESGGQRTFRYRATFSHPVLLTLTLAADGKIAGLQHTEE